VDYSHATTGAVMQLTPEEYSIVNSSRFLLVKADIIGKVKAEFEALQAAYASIAEAENIVLPISAPPKISRGENYKGLPYLVLDYPAVFDKENILAFRTMFWWGNFFSITLHLQGIYKEQYVKNIELKLRDNKLEELYLSCNQTAWEYHYEFDNYRLVNCMSDEQITSVLNQSNFIKLSAKSELSAYEQLQPLMQEWFKMLAGFIKT
jgi:hypothetical protein